MSFCYSIWWNFSSRFLLTGAIPFVTASVFCLGGFLKWLTIISYIILCILCLQKAMTAGSPWQRRLCFALPFLMRVLLTILRISRFGGGNPTAMVHVFLQVRTDCRRCLKEEENWCLFPPATSVAEAASGVGDISVRDIEAHLDRRPNLWWRNWYGLKCLNLFCHQNIAECFHNKLVLLWISLANFPFRNISNP